MSQDHEPDPLLLKSIKFDLQKGRVQIELTDARVLRLEGLPRFNISAEWLQPQTITTARSVDKLVEQAEQETPAPAGKETKEKNPPITRSGKIKGLVREGRPAGDGKPTAWALAAFHEEGSDEAQMASVTFYRHTAAIARSLPPDASITASGYWTPSDDPQRKPSFKIFNLINYTGKQDKQ